MHVQRSHSVVVVDCCDDGEVVAVSWRTRPNWVRDGAVAVSGGFVAVVGLAVVPQPQVQWHCNLIVNGGVIFRRSTLVMTAFSLEGGTISTFLTMAVTVSRK